MEELPIEHARKQLETLAIPDNNNANNNNSKENKFHVPERMKAIPFLKASDRADMKIMEWPTPKISNHEILVKVHAFGLNFADIFARKGQYNDAPPFPTVVGYEVAGVVVEVGSECADQFHVGQKVFAFTDFGGYAEYAKARKEGVVGLRESWSFSQGAAVCVTFVTAYHSLYNTGLLLPGSKVLIHAAAGGVGMALIQLALHGKCEIFGTCGSDDKVKLLTEKGVHHPINYKKTDFEHEVKRITNGKGVDVIIDSVGGSYFKKDLNVLAANGRVIGIGASSTVDRSVGNFFSLVPGVLSMMTLSSIDLMMGSKGFYGVNMKRVADNQPQLVAHSLREIMKLFETGALNIKDVDIQEMDWSKIGEAHTLLETRRTVGKLVLTIPQESH